MIAFSSEHSGDIRRRLGAAHYSYRFVQQRFEAMLTRAGYPCTYVARPEALKTDRAIREATGADPASVAHLIVRSTENIRTVPGVRNICHFAWEFDLLRDDGLPTEPVTENQRQMLSICDEIWVPCSFTQDIMRRYGLDNVHLVPTPVCAEEGADRLPFEQALALLEDVPCFPLACMSGASRDLNGRIVARAMDDLAAVYTARSQRPESRIFLTICNPGDLRKNLLNAIDGFRIAAGSGAGHRLIVKLIVPNVGNYREYALFDHLLPLYKQSVAIFDERVVFTNEFLSDEQMAALYSLSDFYVSASHCEGQNLPLLEAMSFGTVPVSVRNTAMLDYVSDRSSVVIPERRFVGLVPGMAGDVARRSYAIAHADAASIAGAIRTALGLTPAEYRSKAEGARAAVAEGYSEPRVLERVQARLGPPPARS